MAICSSSSRSGGGQTIFLVLACALFLCNVLFSVNNNCSSISISNSDESELMTFHPPAAIQKPTTLPKHNQTFTIGICTIIKDMDAYLNEWLDYHLLAMDIELIYLYDHSPEFYLKSWYENTRTHPVYKRVHVIHWGDLVISQGPQAKAFTDCILRFGKNVEYNMVRNYQSPTKSAERTLNITEGLDYLAHIDGDEFLVPKGDYNSIHDVIGDYLHPYGGALTVNWMLFGSANKSMYSPIPVMKRFQYRDEVPFGVIKTIVKASDFIGVRNAHSVRVKAPALIRTTKHKGAIHKAQFLNVSKTGASDGELPSSALLLHHYRYMSDKEYDDKNCNRGHMAGKKACNGRTGKTLTLEELSEKGKPFHFATITGKVFDDSAWRLLCDRVPKYRIYNDELDWGDYHSAPIVDVNTSRR